MSAKEKLKLLIWKNFLLQRRHKWQTLFEIASPVIFSLFLILVRLLVEPKARTDISYQPFSPTYFNISQYTLGNLTTGNRNGTIAFSPDTPLTRKLTKNAMMKVATDNLGVFAFLLDLSQMPDPKGFANAHEMELALSQPNAMDTILVGIQFDDFMKDAKEWPDDITVTLRYPAVMRTPLLEHPLKASWRTNLLFPIFPKPGPRDPLDKYGGKTPGYAAETFLAVQHAVSQEIIKAKTGKDTGVRVMLQRFAQPAYTEDALLAALERFVSMIIMLCFAYTFVNTVRMVTAEKELQLKETMTIMGLPNWLHWLAWFIKQFSFLLISVGIMVILFKFPFGRTKTGLSYSVLTHTPWHVLFVLMAIFVVASLAFCFMVSVFFTGANTAASFMGLAWFATYSVYMLTQVLYEDITIGTKVTLSLISNAAMGYLLQMVIVREGTSEGLQWKDFFKPASFDDTYTPGHVTMMLILDSILYMLVAMYVERIKPGMYGVPLPWYFPLTKSFWFPNKNRVAGVTGKSAKDHEYADALLKVVHDEEPQGAVMGVDVQNLTKIYHGNKKAVDNLNLRFYENEITVLLGHNGAGKTTTISMITGTIPPTSGCAYINGYDIVTETKRARKSLGICPQHNVLFPDLTVAEHIIFYSRLKGVKGTGAVKKEVDHFVKLLDLERKRDVLSKSLSGGQKRRLSVGTAMCGASKVVLLDEPTSGLDPAARRALWDLLQREKKGRTMILTTHFMDEADVLGDRIAIMSGGALQCFGTPFFLKKHYGTGYKLTVVKADTCQPSDVLLFVKTFIPEAKENTNIGSELTMILPLTSVGSFSDMLRELEIKREALGVNSYGLSVTTLEEVFMKAGAEEFNMNSEVAPPVAGMMFHTNNGNGTVHPLEQGNGESEQMEKIRGVKLLRHHIKAMFLKLMYNSMRNKLSTLIQFVAPIINITISVLIARTWKFLSKLPPLELSLTSGFSATQTLMSHDENITPNGTEHNILRAYESHFENPGNNMELLDIGTRNIEDFYVKLMTADPGRARYENLVGVSVLPGTVTAWMSNYGYHDPAISLAMANNAILRSLSPNATLRIINHPLPYSIDKLVRVMATGSSMGFQFSFNIGFCLAFVTSFLVLFVTKERITGAKLLQRVSGVRPAVLWTCALVWDWLWMLLVHLCIVGTLAVYQESTLKTPEELGRVLLVLMVYSFAVIPLHYLASFYFQSAATGFAKMCFINMFTGCMPFIITEVLRLPEVGSPFYAGIFDWVFSPLPIYCISRSFRDMTVSSFTMSACSGICEQFDIANCTRFTICQKLNQSLCCIEDDPYFRWSEPGVGRYLATMMAVGIIGFTVLLLKEYKVFHQCQKHRYKLPALPAEDDDVSKERAAVTSLAYQETPAYSLVCKDLTKYYKNLVAVNRLTFAVNKCECFGLLGTNGAGKTTTFKMLTGDVPASAGDAYVHGYSVTNQIQDVYKNIGYCPQFDGLLDNLTARETLRIFCLLRGEPEAVGAARANDLAKKLGFSHHFNKKIYECSGGTKRKISTAVALLGDAPLVFLDEPTTGMDPASKRLVWGCIRLAASSGRGVVLTSHSMEECEALCSRLAIMLHGHLACLGTLQHLKNKFSQGYTVIVKCNPLPNREENVSRITEYIRTTFQGSQLIETYLGISTFYVPDAELPWWRVFRDLEAARSLLPIEDYSVSQTTLEQIFMYFTRRGGGNIEEV